MRPALLWLALVALLVGLAPAHQAGEYANRAFGFRLALPRGWSAREVATADGSLHVVVAPPRRRGPAQLALRVFERERLGGAEGARAYALAYAATEAGYESGAPLDVELAGRTLPGLALESRAGDALVRIEQGFLEENGLVFVLQSAARREDFAALAPIFARVWQGFEVDAPAALAGERRLRALAARCGSEVDWAASWEEASERARASGRPILVSARICPGFALSDDTQAVPFMDQDIVALVAERLVPLRLVPGVRVPFADAHIYGLGPSTFGAAALLVTPAGRVVAEAPVASDGFLRRALAEHAELAGPPARALADPLAQAELHLRRGELARAAALLAEPESARAQRLLAALLCRERRGDKALAALERARGASGAAELEVDIWVDEVLVLLRLGRLERAQEILRDVLAQHGDHPRAPEALYHLGASARSVTGRALAEQTWSALVADHPESRWAWLAAAAMTSSAWQLDVGGRLDWAPEPHYAALALAAPAPLPASAARRAEEDALAFLLAHQEPDGSWISPTELARPGRDPSDDFELATVALCTQALLPARAEPRAAAALERALAWLVEAYARARAVPDPAGFMDYGVWSRAYLLACFADCAALEVGRRGALERAAASLVAELARKSQPGGGWSYYRTGDLATRDAPRAQSISFTTAAVVLALSRARAVGFDVPDALLDGGLDCLARMRNPDGTFEYMLAPESARAHASRPAGAAGRGPACTLALQRGGRAGQAELRAALELFLEHRAALAAERGKVLMHTGADAQGSHYLLFDYAHAALATAELPEGERGRLRAALLELVLDARAADGSFVDNPARGAAFGSAMALVALRALRAPI